MSLPVLRRKELKKVKRYVIRAKNSYNFWVWAVIDSTPGVAPELIEPGGNEQWAATPYALYNTRRAAALVAKRLNSVLEQH